MFDFYNLDLLNIVIILISAFVIFVILNKTTNEDEDRGKNIFIIGISLFLGIALSIFISYMGVEKDELLTSNYWE